MCHLVQPRQFWSDYLCPCLQDVWDLCWASDNPELLALMEKGRMYVLRGTDPEEPVNSSACLAGFSDLQVRQVLIAVVWEMPE
jgi:WD repeat-containing protein 35